MSGSLIGVLNGNMGQNEGVGVRIIGMCKFVTSFYSLTQVKYITNKSDS